MFRAVIELVRELFFEKNHELAGGRSILGAAKTKHIDAGLPRDRFRRAIKSGHRIRKPGAIHVDEKRMLAGELADSLDFTALIDRSKLGRLRKAHDPRFRRMDIAMAKQGRVDVLQIQFSIRARRRDKLRAA